MQKQQSKNIRLGLIFLGRKRPGFDPEWGAIMGQKARECAAKTGFEIFEPPEKVVDDPSLRQAIVACDAAGVDAIATLQTTMADARLAPTLSQIWPHPILLWATPEKQTGDMISSCSLVGTHAWASVLRQMDHPFEIVYGDPDDAGAVKQLSDAVRLAHTSRRIGAARVGIIGGQAPGYFAMSADPFSVKGGVGAQVQSFSLMEFTDVAHSFGDEAVAADVEAVRALRLPHKDTDDEILPMASRLYLAMRHYMDEEGVDALSVRCWPEMPNVLGQWPYLGMARLANEGRAVACEGDADGALTALVGECLGMGACYLSDWLEHDEETVTLWHGGNLPMCMSPPPGELGGPQMARHFNNQKPTVVESTLRPGLPVTICRMWRLHGQYVMSASDAEAIQPKRHLMGTNGLARLTGRKPQEWFLDLCHEGMPHHVAVFEGHHTELLERFARLMRMRWVS